MPRSTFFGSSLAAAFPDPEPGVFDPDPQPPSPRPSAPSGPRFTQGDPVLRTIGVPGGQIVQYEDGSQEFVPDPPPTPRAPTTFAPRQPDPDLPARQQFDIEQLRREFDITRQLREIDFGQQQRLEAERGTRETERQRTQIGAETEQQRRQQEFQREQAEMDREIQRAADEATRAHQEGLRALEQGRIDLARQQFAAEDRAREVGFGLERERIALQQQSQSQDALQFLTDLARNPRTAFASLFLNRGREAPAGVATQLSPANITNVSEVLPDFIANLQRAGGAFGTPTTGRTATTSTAGAPAGQQSILQALQGMDAVPPFMQRVFAQLAGDPTQGTNIPQTFSLPRDVPLVSELALRQMSPSEREAFQGFVEANGVRWEDYLSAVTAASPMGRSDTSILPDFLFQAQ